MNDSGYFQRAEELQHVEEEERQLHEYETLTGRTQAENCRSMYYYLNQIDVND